MAAEIPAKDNHPVDMNRVAEINQKYFDDFASSYENPDQRKVAVKITKDLHTHKEWIGVDWVEENGDQAADKTVRVLDYACGPGMVSRAFVPYATELRGIDLAPKMAEQYNNWAQQHNLYPTKMAAISGDLLADAASTMAPEYFNFDLAAVGFAFHHFADPTLAAKKLVERLKPGKGVLLVLDFLPHGADVHHPAMNTVTRLGFTHEEIKDIFSEAGCENIDVVSVGDITFGLDGKQFTREVFMARGTRKLDV